MAIMESHFTRCLLFTIFSIVVYLGCFNFCFAQTYPNRPVRFVVPAAAGGALDSIARILAQKMSEIWKQQIYVENRPGANFGLGMDVVAKARPDAYTLLYVASSGITLNPYIFHDIPLDPARDLKPVIIGSTAPYVLLANPSIPATSLSELVAYLHANPGKLNHASNSATTMMVSELFKMAAGVDYVDVNFRGASQALVSTLGGTTQFCFVDVGSAASALQSGSLRSLAISTPTRYKLNPDIPTFSEAGLAIDVSAFTGLFAPFETPDPLVNEIYGIAKQALESGDIIEKLSAMGNDVHGAGGQVAARLIDAEAKQWRALIKARNIKFQ